MLENENLRKVQGGISGEQAAQHSTRAGAIVYLRLKPLGGNDVIYAGGSGVEAGVVPSNESDDNSLYNWRLALQYIQLLYIMLSEGGKTAYRTIMRTGGYLHGARASWWGPYTKLPYSTIMEGNRKYNLLGIKLPGATLRKVIKYKLFWYQITLFNLK